MNALIDTLGRLGKDDQDQADDTTENNGETSATATVNADDQGALP